MVDEQWIHLCSLWVGTLLRSLPVMLSLWGSRVAFHLFIRNRVISYVCGSSCSCCHRIFHLCLYNISLATRPGYGFDGLHQHNKCVLCQSLPVSCDYPVSHVLSSFPKLCTGITCTPERMGNKMRNVRMCEFFFLNRQWEWCVQCTKAYSYMYLSELTKTVTGTLTGLLVTTSGQYLLDF